MIVDTVREMLVRDSTVKEIDCSVLAQTFVDIFSAKSQKSWSRVVSNGRGPSNRTNPGAQQSDIL